MANITKAAGGYFGGRSLVQQSGQKGGARHVFVKFDDIKDDLVFPPFGGQVMNPFQGAAKIYAGDLMEFRTETDGLKGKVYLLKTYEAAAASTATVVTLVRDGYHHIPFVGDVLMVAPSTIGGKGKVTTVVAITKKNDTNGKPVWELTVDTALTIAKGDILVEGKALAETDSDGNTGEMLVKNINAVAAWDYDFMWSESADPTDDDEFEAARYFLTPTLRGTMYESKMSPIPACVKALNISNINGWFRIDALNKK